jgi:glucose-6-phosphate 1-dehydrogenase
MASIGGSMSTRGENGPAGLTRSGARQAAGVGERAWAGDGAGGELPGPLHGAGARVRRATEPCAFVIFGASGDLTRRKLMPALYALATRRLLPSAFVVLGVGRRELEVEDFRRQMREAVQEHARDAFREDVWRTLEPSIGYVAAGADDPDLERKLGGALADLEARAGTGGNRAWYLALPPAAAPPLVASIGRLRGQGWVRVVLEKPFGHDLQSARELNRLLHEHFQEREIFRIDHYLGKETVQNLLVLRFANGVFEPLWSRQYVDSVQITVAETIGMEGRGAFYDQVGAVRDIFQNHLLQLLALVAMEPPLDFTAESVRNEKLKALRAVLTPGPKHVVRGQYGPAVVDGQEVPGYREEPGVAPDSLTETYVAAKLYIDNWRWADTPFYLRTGKRLARRETTISIAFKRAPHPPFALEAGEDIQANALVVHVQPDEGLSLEVNAKVPGQGLSIRPVDLGFLYGSGFQTDLPDAYERLILDCLLGDPTLFMRADEIEEQWALVEPILAYWQRERVSFPNCPAGSWGPRGATQLLRRDGRSWGVHRWPPGS